MRQFRRLQRIRLKTSAARTVPPAFMGRMIAVHAAHPWRAYSDASVVHDRACLITVAAPLWAIVRLEMNWMLIGIPARDAGRGRISSVPSLLAVS